MLCSQQIRSEINSSLSLSQACEPKFQWLGPFYHRSRETDRLRRAAVSWWFTKPEEVSFIFDPGSIAPVGHAPGPKVDLDQATDEQLRNLAAIADIVDDDSEEDENVAIAKPVDSHEHEDDVVDWATVGARLIAHADRVRELSRGKDWMSRYADDYMERLKDGEGIKVNELLEFPELSHEIFESEEAKSDDDDDLETERLQNLFDQHIRESYPTMDGDFSTEYKKWSSTLDNQ